MMRWKFWFLTMFLKNLKNNCRKSAFSTPQFVNQYLFPERKKQRKVWFMHLGYWQLFK
jgi:hypothetical protein